MKEDVNIEELFKQKFENFEGQIDPSAWANISQGLGTTSGATGATGAGLSGFAKVAIIVSTVTVTSFSVWYFTDKNTDHPEDKETPLITQDNTAEAESTDETANINPEEAIKTDSEADLTEESTDVQEQEGSSEETENITFNEELSDELTAEEEISDQENITPEDKENKDDHGGDGTEKDKPEGEKDSKQPDNVPEIEADPTIVSVNGNNVSFKANARNHDNVTWDFGDGIVRSGDEVTHVYGKPGKYVVSVQVSQSVNGVVKLKGYEFEVEIEGTSSITKIPNIITPNNDNINDYFYIESEGLDQFMIKVFDRSGNEVFTATDPDFRWNGQQKDGSIVKGNYRYILSAIGEDGLTYQTTGALTIQ